MSIFAKLRMVMFDNSGDPKHGCNAISMLALVYITVKIKNSRILTLIVNIDYIIEL